MSVVPANVTNALNAVQADSDAVATNQGLLASAQAALATAQSAVATAQGNVTTAQAQMASDYQALLALLAQTYGPSATTTNAPPASTAAPTGS